MGEIDREAQIERLVHMASSPNTHRRTLLRAGAEDRMSDVLANHGDDLMAARILLAKLPCAPYRTPPRYFPR